ncbi:MAG: ribosome biogenesis GTPase Der [Bradymonadia bacterium]
MKPIVAIVGRPNVGKSTLFNRLIGERRAIVLDTPGVTRDRNYGDCEWLGRHFTVVDTGGFEPKAEEGVLAMMRHQAMAAVEQADVVVFTVDAQSGLVPADREVAHILRCHHERVVYAVNKTENSKYRDQAMEFYELGAEFLVPISAEHGQGIGDLLDAVIEQFEPPAPDEAEEDERVTRVAIVGRPNVGKSTLVNRLLGEDRMITANMPGTTRDAIDAPLTVGETDYLLVDTAGLRRKRGIAKGSIEGFSVMRTLRAIDRCHVAVHLLDATEGVTEQDARILGYVHEKGRALILAVNKWDAIEKDDKTIYTFIDEIERRLPFINYADHLFMSSLTGQRVHKLMAMVDKAREAHLFRVTTGQLNRWLEKAVHKHSPPVVKNRQIKLYYATQARNAPPTVVVQCNDPTGVHFSYQRFLINQFRESFPVHGTPIRLIFRQRERRSSPDEE